LQRRKRGRRTPFLYLQLRGVYITDGSAALVYAKRGRHFGKLAVVNTEHRDREAFPWRPVLFASVLFVRTDILLSFFLSYVLSYFMSYFLSYFLRFPDPDLPSPPSQPASPPERPIIGNQENRF
jgi:hypothetical protein